MKKIVIILILLLTSVFAKKGISFGFNSGFVSANQEFIENEDPIDISFTAEKSKPLLGCKIGFSFEFMFNSFIGIQSEINYVQKGIRDRIRVTTVLYPDGQGYADLIYWLDYIEVPVLQNTKY